MFGKTSLQDWEKLVQQQLKTADIYSVLSKENLEGISVKPYYDSVKQPLPTLPRIEESTQLVAPYLHDSEEGVFAYLLDENVENLTSKSLFINNKDLAEHVAVQDENLYFSLINIFSEDETGELNEQLGKELLAKSFERNICVDVSLHQNAGASMVQQLAFALGKAKEVAETFGPEVFSKLIFRFAIGTDYFLEIGKIRAFKLLFRQLTAEYGLNEWPYIFAETTQRNKALHDPENNLIRSTIELSAAMIGGADAVFSHPYDLSANNVSSQEISFKQQIVLAYESIINVFDDAGNGSYYIEEVTLQLAENAWQLFLQMEEEGGYLQLLKTFKIQHMVYEQSIRAQQWVEEGKTKLIGVNLYPQLQKTRNVEDLYERNLIKPVRLSEMFE